MSNAKILASRQFDGRTVHIIEGAVRDGERLAARQDDGTLAWVTVKSADTLSIAVSDRGGVTQGVVSERHPP